MKTGKFYYLTSQDRIENLDGSFLKSFYAKGFCKMIDVVSLDVTLEAFVLLMSKLCDRYIQYWSDCIKTLGKMMDTYCLMKQMFGLENYIRAVNVRAHRISLFKIRISNHRLAIETDRFSKIPWKERPCVCCKVANISEIEAEKRVLLRCSKFTGIRNHFLSLWENTVPGLICWMKKTNWSTL